MACGRSQDFGGPFRDVRTVLSPLRSASVWLAKRGRKWVGCSTGIVVMAVFGVKRGRKWVGCSTGVVVMAVGDPVTESFGTKAQAAWDALAVGQRLAKRRGITSAWGLRPRTDRRTICLSRRSFPAGTETLTGFRILSRRSFLTGTETLTGVRYHRASSQIAWHRRWGTARVGRRRLSVRARRHIRRSCGYSVRCRVRNRTLRDA